jgi:hypothetical protein
MFQHEVHLLGCHFFSSDNQVTLVLTVFIIHNDDKLAVSEVLYGLLYGVESCFFHPYILNMYYLI